MHDESMWLYCVVLMKPWWYLMSLAVDKSSIRRRAKNCLMLVIIIQNVVVMG